MESSSSVVVSVLCVATEECSELVKVTGTASGADECVVLDRMTGDKEAVGGGKAENWPSELEGFCGWGSCLEREIEEYSFYFFPSIPFS